MKKVVAFVPKYTDLDQSKIKNHEDWHQLKAALDVAPEHIHAHTLISYENFAKQIRIHDTKSVNDTLIFYFNGYGVQDLMYQYIILESHHGIYYVATEDIRRILAGCKCKTIAIFDTGFKVSPDSPTFVSKAIHIDQKAFVRDHRRMYNFPKRYGEKQNRWAFTLAPRFEGFMTKSGKGLVTQVLLEEKSLMPTVTRLNMIQPGAYFASKFKWDARICV